MSLKAYLDAVLDNLATAATAASITLPDLRYPAPGPFTSVSFDCDQVTAAIDSVQRGAPGAPRTDYVQLAECSATVTVAIVRLCMPTSENEMAPLAADQAAAAATTLADLDLLWTNAKAILNAGGCTHHGLVIAKPIEIQGAVGGALLTGTIDLLEATV